MLGLIGIIGLVIAFVRHQREGGGPAGPAVGPAAAPAPAGAKSAAPRTLRLSVVEIGSMRYFDVRTFPFDAFIGHVPIDAAKSAVRDMPPVAAHVWVMPRGFEGWLEALDETALVIVLSRLKDPATGTTAVTFVYVDGWVPSPGKIDSMARACGVGLLLELPRLLEPGVPERSVLAMLDDAARR